MHLGVHLGDAPPKQQRAEWTHPSHEVHSSSPVQQQRGHVNVAIVSRDVEGGEAALTVEESHTARTRRQTSTHIALQPMTQPCTFQVRPAARWAVHRGLWLVVSHTPSDRDTFCYTPLHRHLTFLSQWQKKSFYWSMEHGASGMLTAGFTIPPGLLCAFMILQYMYTQIKQAWV